MMLRELQVIETLTAVQAFALTAGLVSARATFRPVTASRNDPQTEITFEVTRGADGYSAKSVTGGMATQADTWQALRANIRSGLKALYLDRVDTFRIRLHVVRDEVLLIN